MSAEPEPDGPIEMETVACGLCGSTDSRVELRAPDRLYHVRGLFTIERCARCGLAFQNPRPRLDQIGRLYADAYGPHQDARPPDDLPPLARWGRTIERAAASRYYGPLSEAKGGGGGAGLPSFWVLVARVLQLPVLPPNEPGAQGPSRVLDIGCSTGRFLAHMKSWGWEVQGVEPDSAAAGRAQALFGVPVVNEAFGRGQFEPESFALVTMWNVLEHLPDPLDSLVEVARLLRPGGWFVAQVPNLKSLEVRLAGDKAFQLDLPRHFYHLEAATLSDLVTKAGLRPARIVYPIEPFSLYMSLGRMLKVFSRSTSSRGGIWLQRLLWPLCAILSWSGSGAQMAVLASKPVGAE